MKRLLSLAACIMIAVLSYAHDFVVDDIYYDITSSSEPYTVAVTFEGTEPTSYSNEYTGEITIPEAVTYNGTTYSVTSIGDYAFNSCSGLTSVTIGNSVTTIGASTFNGCSNLTSVTINSNAVVSKNYTSYWSLGGIFGEQVKEYVLGDAVTSIGDYAFSRCNGLTSITIPNSVTSIGNSAFYDCTGLKKVIVKDLAAWCNISFYNYYANPLYFAHHLYSDENTDITNLKIPESVTSIGDYAFNSCSGLTSVTIGNSVTSIGFYAFEGCRRLTSVTIGNSVTSIGSSAFFDCSGLTSVTIPNSVKSIDDDAFNGCRRLTSVSIGNSVTSIGSRAFNGCSGLTSVTINSNAIVSKDYRSSSSLKLKNVFGAQVQEYVLGDAVTNIGDYAFYKCDGLTSVTIGNSVTSIGSSAFNGCSGLTSVSIPESVTNIAMYAFSGCSALTSVTIPNSVTSIGYYAFASCGGLTSIVVEESNSYYDSRNNCNAIIETASNTLIAGCQNTVIPESVTSIGNSAFASCGGLTSITIPNSVTSIGDYAFRYCTGLTSITIPENVTSIGDGAFYGCEGLTSIISYIKEPFDTDYCWYGVDKSIPLYVPAGTKEKYQQTIGWSDFTNIIELGAETLEPAEEAEEVDLSQLPDELELNGVVYNNTYYALDAENGDGADSENGCVIINSITTDEAVNSIVGKDISDESVKDAFRGIIFMVPAGSGIVSVTAETNGPKTLVVKIGSQEAQMFTLAERETVKIAYTVDKPTYVYVYAGETEAPLAKGMEGTETEEGCVKVYSYKWESAEPTGMESFTSASSPKSEESQYYYTIDGQRITGKPTKSGIYINGGKKVVVK